jgi:hypothetical protein
LTENERLSLKVDITNILNLQEKKVKEQLSLEVDIVNILDVQVKDVASCASCMKNDISTREGLYCSNESNPHFLCKNNYFSDMVTSQSNHNGEFVKNNSKIVCPECIAFKPPVISPFYGSTVGKHTDEDALAAYISAYVEVERSKGSIELEKLKLQHRRDLQEEKESKIRDPVLKMKAAAARHHQDIIDDILTLRCPVLIVAAPF